MSIKELEYLPEEGLTVGDQIVLNQNEAFWPGRQGTIKKIEVNSPLLTLDMDPWHGKKVKEGSQRIFRTPRFVSKLGTDVNEVSTQPGGSNPKQYGLPEGSKDLQDLIEYRGMNFAVGNIFKACYRLGTCSHSDELRDLRKILWFADREIKRLENRDVEGE